ncbi:ParA family protein [Psychrosphaera aestuarii]|uniref:ParA family protein n=1 Tax=Psychrosphaera aestuarii TaxID=1266052 RepID=UPI001B31D537|nr:ParA family protein [Psychrosphaera aestuarii]
MKVWTVANQKGGVGKTTTVITLGAILAQQGKKVLMIDTDPHASLTYYFGLDSEQLEYGVYDVFTRSDTMDQAYWNKCTWQSPVPNLDILPATMAMATLDGVLSKKSGMGLIIKKALAKFATEYDHVIIDCPPILGVLMVNALAACDKVLIPVQTECMALKGLERMYRTMELIQSSQSKEYDVCIIPTMYDKRTKASKVAYKELNHMYANKVWQGVIPIDTNFRTASMERTPLPIFNKNSRGVFAYQELLKQIENN